MRILFMGTPEFATSTLVALIEQHNVVAVVTQPDRKQGRKMVLTPSPVKVEALKHGIPVFQPEKIKRKSAVEELKQWKADLFVVAAYGQILSEEILNIPRFGCINVHASLLPKYRGASPIAQAVLHGDKTTGITIMQMDKGMDTGDILLQKEIELDSTETTKTLQDKLQVLGAEALLLALTQLEKGTLFPIKQDNELATHAPMLTKQMAKMDWNQPAEKLFYLVRGMNPWPTAYFIYNNEPMKVWEANVVCKEELQDALLENTQPGTVVASNQEKGIVVACGNGYLQLKEIQAQNGKIMSTADYLKGHKVPLHTLFE